MYFEAVPVPRAFVGLSFVEFNWFHVKGSLCPAFDVLSLPGIQLSKPNRALGVWLISFAVNCVLYSIKFLVA